MLNDFLISKDYNNHYKNSNHKNIEYILVIFKTFNDNIKGLLEMLDQQIYLMPSCKLSFK